MRAILVIFVVLLVVTSFFLIGDYINIPLWPINVLNRMYQLEIHCRIDGLDPEIFSAIVTAEAGISCDIRYRDKEQVRHGTNLEMKTDLAGVYRIYLPEGKYLFHAEILGFLNDQLYHYATGLADEFLTVSHLASIGPTDVFLTRLDVENFDILQVKLERLIKAGGIFTAKVLLDERLSRRTDSITPQQYRTLEVQSRQIVELIDHCRQFQELDETQYVSRLQRLKTIRELFSRLAPSLKASQYQCKIDERMINVAVGIQAIRESLSMIFTNYFRNMDNFMEIKRYDKVFEFWLRLTTNTELYSVPLEVDRPDLQARLRYYADKMPEVQHHIIQRLEQQLEKGREFYEAGQLDQAYNSFFRGQMTIDNFKQNLELSEEIITSFSSFLLDIQTIRIAQNHEEMDDRVRASELYDHVVNDCQWLRVLKAELAQQH